MADTREDCIRQRAHLLWEAAGQPDGDDAAHWHQAETEIDAADAPPVADIAPEPAPAKPKPASAAARKPRAAPKPRAPKKA